MAFKQLTQRIQNIRWRVQDDLGDPSTRAQIIKTARFIMIGIVLIFILLILWINRIPDQFNPVENAIQMAASKQQNVVTGYTSTATIITLADILINKPGGYLSNDVTPPSIWMDNVPNWEFGVLVQIRDFSRALRNDISRSQSQSLEDEDLAIAEPQFNFNSNSWLFPPSEHEYKKGIRSLESYLARLSSEEQTDAQFYARADNLADWLAIVEKRLGSLSQRLTASVGQIRINTDLAGDSAAQQSTSSSAEIVAKTPWLQIDDVFYEARGTSWALIHLLKAMEHDFSTILKKKNALVSLRQIIRELESTQDTVWSPMILNGSGFGMRANHSLVMASYISRANAAMIDLQALLNRG
ncbi:MAG: DUF2333 family protein [Methylophagaceae bacterium]